MARLADIWGVPEATFRALVDARCSRPQTRLPRQDVHDGALAGDALLPATATTITRAVTIARPACAVWPWLAQLMRGGGVYGSPMLETPECRSAEYLLKDLPAPRIGDRIGNILTLVCVRPCRELVWSAQGGVELLGFRISGLTLDYALEPLGEAACILRARLRGLGENLTEPVERYLFGVLDYLLCAPQLARIRALAEGAAADAETGCGSGAPRAHQGAALIRDAEGPDEAPGKGGSPPERNGRKAHE